MDFIDTLFTVKNIFNFDEIEYTCKLIDGRFYFETEIDTYYVDSDNYKQSIEYIKKDIKRHAESIAYKIPKECNYYIPYGRLQKLNYACELINKLSNDLPSINCKYSGGYFTVTYGNFRLEVYSDHFVFYGGEYGNTFIKSSTFSGYVDEEIAIQNISIMATSIAKQIVENMPSISHVNNKVIIDVSKLTKQQVKDLQECVFDWMKDLST